MFWNTFPFQIKSSGLELCMLQGILGHIKGPYSIFLDLSVNCKHALEHSFYLLLQG